MDKKRLKIFHDRLMTERAALRGVVVRNEDYGREADIEATQDPADKASNSYTKELLFSQSTNDRQILMQIEEALQRIRDEEYGVCGNCNKEIGPKRLEALPWVRFCIDCQDLSVRRLLDDDDIEQLNEQIISSLVEQALVEQALIVEQVRQIVRAHGEQTTFPFSESRIALYLLISAIAGFVLLRVVTDQEVIVALGTLNIAIIGMWVWALFRKARALTQSLTSPKGDVPEV
ncbi:MAG: TraR/DksA family transcriptional regulator [Blastocatellia bacterium]